MMANESTEKNREVTSQGPDLGDSMEPKQTASCSYLSLPYLRRDVTNTACGVGMFAAQAGLCEVLTSEVVA